MENYSLADFDMLNTFIFFFSVSMFKTALVHLKTQVSSVNSL